MSLHVEDHILEYPLSPTKKIFCGANPGVSGKAHGGFRVGFRPECLVDGLVSVRFDLIFELPFERVLSNDV
jgi:hypothetical protein